MNDEKLKELREDSMKEAVEIEVLNDDPVCIIMPSSAVTPECWHTSLEWDKAGHILVCKSCGRKFIPKRRGKE